MLTAARTTTIPSASRLSVRPIAIPPIHHNLVNQVSPLSLPLSPHTPTHPPQRATYGVPNQQRAKTPTPTLRQLFAVCELPSLRLFWAQRTRAHTNRSIINSCYYFAFAESRARCCSCCSWERTSPAKQVHTLKPQDRIASRARHGSHGSQAGHCATSKGQREKSKLQLVCMHVHCGM
jgi:hypothetical protein